MLGEWFTRTRKRSKIFPATKCGVKRESGTFGIDSSADYCRRACEQSLEKLGVEGGDLCKPGLNKGRVRLETYLDRLHSSSQPWHTSGGDHESYGIAQSVSSPPHQPET